MPRWLSAVLAALLLVLVLLLLRRCAPSSPAVSEAPAAPKPAAPVRKRPAVVEAKPPRPRRGRWLEFEVADTRPYQMGAVEIDLDGKAVVKRRLTRRELDSPLNLPHGGWNPDFSIPLPSKPQVSVTIVVAGPHGTQRLKLTRVVDGRHYGHGDGFQRFDDPARGLGWGLRFMDENGPLSDDDFIAHDPGRP